MPLYDPGNCPHRADVYSVASTGDTGGGTGLAYTLVQSDVPCWAPSLSSGETERFGQTQIATQHSIYFKASVLTNPIERGWKLVVNGVTLHVKGINPNQAAGTIPPLVKIDCESLE